MLIDHNFNSIVLRSLLETKIVFKDQIFDLFKGMSVIFIEEINKYKNNKNKKSTKTLRLSISTHKICCAISVAP